MKDNISVSILDAKEKIEFLDNLKRVQQSIEKLNIKPSVFDMLIHFDVMDSKFVPNKGVELEHIKDVKKRNFYADVHLMVEDPIGDKYIDNAIEYGADNITIHYEIENFNNTLNYLLKKKKYLKDKENKNLSIGVALKPSTSIDVLKKYIKKIDKILLMSVNPGKGGQKYIEEVTDKITFARNSFKDIILQIDGGINYDTICKPIRKGINSVVIGSFLSKTSDFFILYNKVIALNAIHTIEKAPRKANLKLDNTILQVVPGGYGENDILLGINTPDIRKCANIWYKYIDLNEIETFFKSEFHDYRRFAIFCIINKVSKLYKQVLKDKKDKKNLKELKNMFAFFESNIEYVNNWDLTDIAGPNILAYNLYILNSKERKKKLFSYLDNKNFWVKRIGIVSMLNFVRKGELELPLSVCDYVIYDQFHLFQKATGWVLREIYKKEPKIIVEYLSDKNSKRKLPGILLSYACEKMSIIEKEKIKSDIGEV